jgi:cysteine desulfurase / selenocysteine lyase
MPDPVWRAVRDHLDLEREVGGYEAAARERRPVLAPSTTSSPRCSAARATRSPSSRTPPAPGTWPSTPPLRGRPHPHRPGRVRQQLHRLPPGRKRTGARVEVVPDDEHGQVSVEALREMIGTRTSSCRHHPRADQRRAGQPAAAIGAVAREAGVLYLLDACQSVGQMPVDVARSAATCSRPPGASSCAGRAAPASSTSRRAIWTGSSRPSSTCTRRAGPSRCCRRRRSACPPA